MDADLKLFCWPSTGAGTGAGAEALELWAQALGSGAVAGRVPHFAPAPAPATLRLPAPARPTPPARMIKCRSLPTIDERSKGWAGTHSVTCAE